MEDHVKDFTTPKELLGKRFGSLVVKGRIRIDKTNFILCDCDCGQETHRAKAMLSDVAACYDCSRIRRKENFRRIDDYYSRSSVPKKNKISYKDVFNL